jgi:catechol 2,3-dioxygenase
MTTEPLDIQDVITAGRGLPWQGATAGTVMGHVHLHVGTLSDAEAFYHRALGFDKTVWNYPGALFFSAGGYHHHLGANTWSLGPSARDDEARLLDWELNLPDADASSAAADSLRASGYDVQHAGGSWIAADPWGTCLRLVASDSGARPSSTDS